ncbi:hypothetical protein FOCC_FOCC004663 [Frankliniella occidentalis]|nr:hypothetical protein FOCC_FOCC004663 [Frankliniella occidentalis]
MILDPVLKALNEASTEPALAINRRCVRDLIQAEAQKLRAEIREECVGKMICIKVDAASRKDRRVFSINIQYIHKGELQTRNLCVRETKEAHSGSFLSELIIDTLHEFDLLASQVLSGTADNGANVKAALNFLPGPDLSTAQFNCFHAGVIDTDSEDDDDINEQIPSGDEDGSDISDTEPEENGEEKSSADECDPFPSLAESTFEHEDGDNLCQECLALKHGVQFSGVTYVPCAAHTLQLAVGDALNLSPILSLTKKARKMATKLRTHRYAVRLEQLGLTKPVLNNETRWSSTYTMMESLLKLRTGIEQIVEEEEKAQKKSGKRKKSTTMPKETTPAPRKKTRKLQNLSPYQWRQVKAYCKALEPAAICTVKLQASDLTAGQFYGEWLACVERTKKVRNLLATRVLAAIKQREKSLFESDVFLPSVFMDPRYKNLLTNDQRKKAISYLQALSVRLENMSEGEKEDDSGNEVREEVNEEEDILENILKSTEKEEDARESSLLKILTDYSASGRIAKETDIFKYWYDNRKKHPVLFKLSEVMLAVPMTQVSVERTFSHFKQILSVLRFNLSGDIMNDILFLKCNFHLKK